VPLTQLKSSSAELAFKEKAKIPPPHHVNELAAGKPRRE
jgi:hypothetical protein